jgi:lipopolysaccharide/colanic/teichoic acid biosynthesis glycosyltransferase
MTKGIRFTKRVIDVVGSTVGLVLILPFLPILALAIVLESAGPVFVFQRRAGMLIRSEGSGVGHRPRFVEFPLVKFRTMRPDAEKITGPVLSSGSDPRITRVGRFLRRSRIDELPQLWNVLKGDMSLVGPRPERAELLEQLAMAIPYFEERMRGLKPGLTGLSQISLGYTGRPPPDSTLMPYADQLTNPFKVTESEGALADHMRLKMLYDMAYAAAAENFRTYLQTELSILVRTPLVLLRSTRA